MAGDWQAQSKVAVEALETLQASVDAGVRTHLRGLFFQLDEANRSMLTKLRTTYCVFASNPCGLPADWLDKRTREVMAEETTFRTITIETHRLQALVAGGIADNELIIELAKSIEATKPIEQRLATKAVKDVPKIVDDWQQGLE
jgi:hypothetical protein